MWGKGSIITSLLRKEVRGETAVMWGKGSIITSLLRKEVIGETEVMWGKGSIETLQFIFKGAHF